MNKKESITINEKDTVAVALVNQNGIPAGHKFALKAIKKGESIIKYGYPIGFALQDIAKGEHVHTHNVKTLLSENAEYSYNKEKAAFYMENARKNAEIAPKITAFKRKNGAIGIRNEIWIIPTVGCVNKTAETLAQWAHNQFGQKNGIDGVFAWTHPYGCSQMGDDHKKTRTVLADLVLHPNAAAVLVIGLGCENNTIEEFKKSITVQEHGTLDESRLRFLITQKVSDEIAEGKKLLTELADFASQFSREEVSANELVIGLKCGGSDGFSGITANALVGKVCDSITQIGGTVLLTEVPEMFGAEQLLMDRCINKEVYQKTVSLIDNFKHYFTSHNQVVYENPSPGNKEGGISTLEDKSLGCVQKGGAAPVCGVLNYGEKVEQTNKGLYLLEGPGNDIVSTTAMTAAGAHIILFTTGRGTPLGAPVPTLKIASNSNLAQNKPNWIDFNAERIFEEDGEKVLADLLQLIFDTASGKKQTKNEQNGYREIAIFKEGVTL